MGWASRHGKIRALQGAKNEGPKRNRKRLPEAPGPTSRKERLLGVAAYCRRRLGGALPVLGIFGAVMVFLGLLVLGHRWLTHSPRFALATLDTRGNHALVKEELWQVLNVDGVNIFRVDLASATDRLLRHPWVKEAEVTRDFPDGLTVEIVEHEPAAAVELDGLYLVDSQGTVFKRASQTNDELSGLVVITGIAREEFVTKPETTNERLRQAILSLGQYRKNPSRPHLGEVHLDLMRGLTFVTFEDGVAIDIGNAKLEEQQERLLAFDRTWASLTEVERKAARTFRIADRTPSDRVTVAFAGN